METLTTMDLEVIINAMEQYMIAHGTSHENRNLTLYTLRKVRKISPKQ
jgi:hypothetical protein